MIFNEYLNTFLYKNKAASVHKIYNSIIYNLCRVYIINQIRHINTIFARIIIIIRHIF
jgi:hypothetical protein